VRRRPTSGVRRPASPRIRQARPGDWPELVALEERCFPVSDRFPARAWRRLVGPARTARTAVTLVVDEGGAVAAAVCGLFRARSRVARVYSLAVGPEQRGRGLGKALVRALARVARARGCRWVVLEVRQGNASARAVYESLGFAIDRRLPGYYGPRRHGLRYKAPVTGLLS
jgi:[ribosomal protein S18]-alanine N-acetyltransferase